MKSLLNPWIASVLLIALLIVGSALCRSWLQLDQEVKKTSIMFPPMQSISKDKGHHENQVNDSHSDPLSAAQLPSTSTLTASNYLTIPDPIPSLSGASAHLASPSVAPPLVSAARLPVNSSTAATGVSATHAHDLSAGSVAAAPSTHTSSGTVGASGSVVPGSFVSAAAGSSAVPQNGSSQTAPAIPEGVSIPVAFNNPAGLEKSVPQSQQAAIAQIANDFTTAVQSSGAAPNTPEYKQVWDTAAYQADERFRGMFGIPAFNAMQMARGY